MSQSWSQRNEVAHVRCGLPAHIAKWNLGFGRSFLLQGSEILTLYTECFSYSAELHGTEVGGEVSRSLELWEKYKSFSLGDYSVCLYFLVLSTRHVLLELTRALPCILSVLVAVKMLFTECTNALPSCVIVPLLIPQNNWITNVRAWFLTESTLFCYKIWPILILLSFLYCHPFPPQINKICSHGNCKY